LHAAAEQIPDGDDVAAACDRELRRQRRGSRRGDDEVRLVGEDGIGRCLRPEPDVDAEALQLPLGVEDEVEQLLARGPCCGEP
jgi:hypothetical protein